VVYVWFGCRIIGMDRILSLVSSRRQPVLEYCERGRTKVTTTMTDLTGEVHGKSLLLRGWHECWREP
jgi:hypothetical protein